jgi:hypothetical protein
MADVLLQLDLLGRDQFVPVKVISLACSALTFVWSVVVDGGICCAYTCNPSKPAQVAAAAVIESNRLMLTSLLNHFR